jgi:S-adenosylmethionine:tRNA ribosyltransferase-isomerase
MGVARAFVTLHVGLDTFRPVRVDDLKDHEMHSEQIEISEEAAEIINHTKGRIISVGTTSARTLESAAVGPRQVRATKENTRLFITPGYEFKVVEGMLTNFHLPHSTLLVMISALAGRERVLSAYEEAVRLKYRFFSFGDAMLIL